MVAKLNNPQGPEKDEVWCTDEIIWTFGNVFA